ncbi:MAG TPA: Hpt domain-containing protein, partial [Brevundimonas sp.]|nr:Hpt domain-containing protein [Brevundimonas sp.]
RGGFGGVDAKAIAKAEEALQAMSSQFAQWLQDEIEKLDKAQADIRDKGYNTETAEALYFRAHDLKGLGTTYQYPL